MRKVFLENLPRWESGSYATEGSIDWEKSINHEVSFIYNDIQSKVKIIDYDRNGILYIKYNTNEAFKIHIANFIACKLGKLLGKITGSFKIEKGVQFIDTKRDILVIDREYRKNNKGTKSKWYQYKCNKCGYEGWIIESSLLNGSGCSRCCKYNSIPTLGFNTIWDVARWMYDLGISEEDAKKFTPRSRKYIYVKCPVCGRTKNKPIMICNIYANHSIGCDCSDTIPYPEKIMFAVLEQLKVNFVNQLTRKNYKWCENHRYDFYIHEARCIIETNGIQHYEENPRGRSLQEEQFNDEVKKDKAKENGVENYIVIDCRKSELDYIRNNILNSKLAELFDLSKINWNKVEEFALSNLVLKVCEIKKDNPDMTTVEISKIVNLNYSTVRSYLKKGSNIWDWVNYNAKEETDKSLEKGRIGSRKQVEIFKNSTSLGVFESCSELARQSEDLFGVKLSSSHISRVIVGGRKTHKGFAFKYIENTTSA